MDLDPWAVELLTSRGVDDRRSVVRDADRGLLVRVRRGAYLQADAWQRATPEQQHLIRLRAATAVAEGPLVVSHWSAAVVHGLPLLPGRLARLHTTVHRAGSRGTDEIAGHVFALTEAEVVRRGDLLVTDRGRTVVDVAGAATIEEGVMAADAALAAGLPKQLLHAAVDLAGPRRSARRTATVVDFADPGGRSAAESSSRWTMHRLGVEPPVLQHRVHDARGHVGDADFWFPDADAAGEVDGLKKYLDPRFAPRGAAMKVYEEKLREDRLRACVARLARWGWAESRDPRLLGPVLARVGVHPARRVVLL